jgi:hypothetical protein
MEAQLVLIVVKGRVQLMGSMHATPVDDHHDLFPGFAERGHHLMTILAQFLGINMGDDLIEDGGVSIVDIGGNNTL